MHLLITGGAGFIGSHIAPLALEQGHQVTIVDNLSQGIPENIPPGAEFVYGDILDPENWMGKVAPVDAVIHLAAQISVPAGEKDPLEDLRLNLEGTLKMLITGKNLGAKQFRLASSAAVYGSEWRLPLKEGLMVSPMAFYGWSKFTAERYVFHFAELHGLEAIVLRLANVYGPRQRTQGEGGVVAMFCEAFAQDRLPEIHGDGSQTRDFVYVGDVARAFLHRLTDPGPARVYNVCTEAATQVRELATMLAGLSHKNADDFRRGPTRPGDIHDSVLSSREAERWGFLAITSLAEGLDLTWKYFLNRES